MEDAIERAQPYRLPLTLTWGEQEHRDSRLLIFLDAVVAIFAGAAIAMILRTKHDVSNGSWELLLALPVFVALFVALLPLQRMTIWRTTRAREQVDEFRGREFPLSRDEPATMSYLNPILTSAGVVPVEPDFVGTEADDTKVAFGAKAVELRRREWALQLTGRVVVLMARNQSRADVELLFPELKYGLAA